MGTSLSSLSRSITSVQISDQTLTQIQACSGLVFSSFATIHILNSFTAHFGHLAYDAIQDILRKFYQNRVIEAVLAGALIIHIGSSSIIFYRRYTGHRTPQVKRRRMSMPPQKENLLDSIKEKINEKVDLTPRSIHRYTGYVLAGVIGIHVLNTRITMWNNPPDFTFLNFSLKNWPIIMYPYYMTLLTSGIYHTYFGIQQALHALGVKFPEWTRGSFFWFSLEMGLLIGASSVLAFGGVYYNVPTFRFQEWKNHHQDVVPRLFHWVLPWMRGLK